MAQCVEIWDNPMDILSLVKKSQQPNTNNTQYFKNIPEQISHRVINFDEEASTHQYLAQWYEYRRTLHNNRFQQRLDYATWNSLSRQEQLMRSKVTQQMITQYHEQYQ